MRYFEKMEWNPNPDVVPRLAMQTADVPCFHCGRITRVVVKPEHVNWERMAEKYRQGYEKLLQRFGQIVTDVTVMHSGTNPVIEYIDNEWKVLIDDLRKDLER